MAYMGANRRNAYRVLVGKSEAVKRKETTRKTSMHVGG
jgi:hypothetical protein